MLNSGLHRCIFLVMGLLYFQNVTAQEEQLSIKASDTTLKNTIRDYIIKGDNLKTLLEFEKAKEYYTKAFNLSLQSGYPLLRNEAGYKNITLFLRFLREYDKAIALNKLLYQYNCEEDNEYGVLYALLKEGGIWFVKKEHKKALTRFTEVINVLEDTDYTYLKWFAYQNRGNILITLDRDKISKAKYDYDKAVFYLSSRNSIEDSINAYSGSIWSEQNLDKKAALYSKLKNDKCNRTKIHPACYYVYLNLAQTLLANKEHQKALKVFTENDFFQSDKAPKYSDWPGIHFMVLGKIYAALNDDVLAIKNMKIAQNLYQKSQQWLLLVEITELLSGVYKKQGATKKENEELQRIKGFMQSFHKEKLNKQTTEIKNKQLLEAKQSRISVLAQENEEIVRKKDNAKAFIQFLVWFLGVFVVFVICWRVYEKLKFHKLNEKINHNRLRSLQINMNPHFLFNSFSTLQNFILKKEKKKAVAYMQDLSGLINNIFYSSDTIYINFVDEINILKTYVSLERGRFYNDFEVFWDIAPALETTNPMIPSMMIQPHIENAIIHGFSHSEKTKQLDISFSFKNDTHVFVKIKDNGVGRLAAARIKEQSGATVKSLSIATKNIQERMDIMKDSRIGTGSVTVFDLTDPLRNIQGTEVHLVLPVINQNKSYKPYVEEYNN